METYYRTGEQGEVSEEHRREVSSKRWSEAGEGTQMRKGKMSSGADQRRVQCVDVGKWRDSRSVDGWKYKQEIVWKMEADKRGGCAQERTRVMGEEMSEAAG